MREAKKKTDLKDKGFVSLCCQPDFYLRAYAAPTQTSMPYVTINAQSTTIPRAPFVVLYDLKPLVFERVQHCLGAPLQWGPGANCPCCPPPSAALQPEIGRNILRVMWLIRLFLCQNGLRAFHF